MGFGVELTRRFVVSFVGSIFGRVLFRWRKEAGLTGKRQQTDDPRGSRLVEGFIPVRFSL